MAIILNALLLASLAPSQVWASPVSLKRAAQCSCYASNGATSQFYTERIFQDFRNLSSQGQYNAEPANVTTSRRGGSSGSGAGQNGYLQTAEFTDNWAIQTWSAPAGQDNPVTRQNSNQNVYIQVNDDDPLLTHLTLRAYRTSRAATTAEMESARHDFLHASIRYKARVRGAPGVCAGAFTYESDTQESDIEILTKDSTSQIWYTNQPSESDHAKLPTGGDWTQWNTHQLDWTAGYTAWYFNEVLMEQNSVNVPKVPSLIDFNMWSNGGTWTGDMAVGSAAYFDIEWIDIVFNTTSSSSTKCSSVCNVEDLVR